MGLVSNDLSDWLAETRAQPDSAPASAENPFGAGAAHSANVRLHALWHRAGQRLHRWLDPRWHPDDGHGDGLAR
jgi:hypothetical protein